ncbi:asparagine--tRNA ligase [archaeon]|jgi:asparaginyl-tRNA synthetase|nr:asparagine--tRNA ligase [archaeon]
MKFISIKQAIKKGSGKVSVRGWVYRERGSNKMKFIVLRDSSDIIQCVIKREDFEKQWGEIDGLKIESSVELEGMIKEDKRAPTGYEISVSKINIVHVAEDYPINKDLNEDLLGDRRHLWLRSRKMTAMLKIRSTVFGAFHEYFRKNGFYEFQSPLMLNAAGESGSSVFRVNYFGKEMFLAQTWQLHAETAIFALEKIYTMAPSFRAEKSNTIRHLCEYWHCEMEAAWANYEGLQKYAEGLLKYVVKKVLEINKEELEILERDIKILESTAKKEFPNITYTEAIKVLEKQGMKLKWGDDFGKTEEDKLSTLYDTPIIVRDFPKLMKAFYMKESPGMEDVPLDKKTVQGFDVIGPEEYGELFGASQREEDIEIIKENLLREGEKLENYEFYFDSRRYGSVPHGGFGVGVDRIVSWICGMRTIKDAIPFPRTMRRMSP